MSNKTILCLLVIAPILYFGIIYPLHRINCLRVGMDADLWIHGCIIKQTEE
jgi:hypothetical protein